MPKFIAQIEVTASNLGKANLIIDSALKEWMKNNREVLSYSIIKIVEVRK